ncbi:MAG: ATP-NAD kinase [Thermoplasmata archaeon]|nr:MAG: ATP-NAD kinase [Thermoplasmata archaeon]
MKIGVVVNPIAGMGGAVGLKGTDGVAEEAARRGARQISIPRAREALAGIEKYGEVITCSSSMGEDCLDAGERNFEIVYEPADRTTSEDTKEACREFLRKNAKLIIFCGGDGTARDVLSVVGKKVPILGVPAGVKMHSSVFSISPRAANRVILDFLEGNASVVDAEVMDVDEDAFRRGEIKIRHYGDASIPYKKILMQQGKHLFYSPDEKIYKDAMASFLSLVMRKGTYIVGGGSTTGHIVNSMGMEKTLLGVDIIKDGELFVKDACESDILESLNGGTTRIMVSPMGRQGFIFGRGNQQISSEVIKRVGTENIILVATPYKLSQTPHLFVDTGDAKLDKKLSGWKSVITGFGLAERKKVIGM